MNNLENKQIELAQIESCQRQHFDVLAHQERMYVLVQKAEYNLFSVIKPKLFKDGNQWCCLYGKNIQEGIVGFGETPYKAILEWNKCWYNQ